jgi:adenosylmethionine-8-amino-7-oxononanoate aminotransferase
MRELCDRYDTLLIADEVATGFGRTGRMFACEYEGVSPDLMCLAKGLTGGYLPLAATLATERIYQAFLGEYHEFKTFFHGHSYTGNPLACAAALANLEVFERERVIDGLPPKIERVRYGLEWFRELSHVGEVRQCGLMVGIELVRDRTTGEPYPREQQMGARVCRRARPLGLITRPLGDVVIFMPPLASTEADLDAMLAILHQAIALVTEDGEPG